MPVKQELIDFPRQRLCACRDPSGTITRSPFFPHVLLTIRWAGQAIPSRLPLLAPFSPHDVSRLQIVAGAVLLVL